MVQTYLPEINCAAQDINPTQAFTGELHNVSLHEHALAAHMQDMPLEYNFCDCLLLGMDGRMLTLWHSHHQIP